MSRIVKIRPLTSQPMEIVFAGSQEKPFYTSQRGMQQRLPGGHLLITEAEGGRVFEIDQEQDIVWEMRMKRNNSAISTAKRYTADQLPFLTSEKQAL